MIFCFTTFLIAAAQVNWEPSTNIVKSSSPEVALVKAPPIKCGGPVDAFSVVLCLAGLDVGNLELRKEGVLTFSKEVGPFKTAVVSEFASEFKPPTQSYRWGGKAESLVATASVENVSFDEGVKLLRQLKETIEDAMWVNEVVDFEESLIPGSMFALKTAKPGPALWMLELRLEVIGKTTKYQLRLWRRKASKSEDGKADASDQIEVDI